MLIGAMNHPREEVLSEIAKIAGMDFDFIDLTLEPPRAAVELVDPYETRAAIEEHRLRVVGHTAFYLPLASPFEELRQGAIVAMRRCLEAFAKIGAQWVNVHPDRYAPMHDRPFFIQRDIDTLGELLDDARRLGVGLMVENIPGDFNSAQQLGELLDPLPELGLHLDIGHTNLMVPANTTMEILEKYGDRLRHVHLHDNRGGHADLHLPLGAGTVPVRECLQALQKAGYDDTITLEVFTPDEHYLLYSRDQLRQLWDELA